MADPLLPGLIQVKQEEDNSIPNQSPPNLIHDVEDGSIANVFYFVAFANKVNGVVYNNCTGNFAHMLLDGSICFFCNVPLWKTCYRLVWATLKTDASSTILDL
jgi:hypothetical protein